MPENPVKLQTFNLDNRLNAIDAALDRLKEQRIIPRIWIKDWSVWASDPTEIADRLGWLNAPEEASRNEPEYTAFADKVRRDGFRQALLLGMGGSSLAPGVFGAVFKTKRGFLDLQTLDSTDPAAVLRAKASVPPKKTVFIVSSKSGTTIETLSFLKYFYNESLVTSGDRTAGARFAAITDPGTPLEKTARENGFLAVFHGNPEIGGRFSALSAFGLVPAALKGIDLKKLLKSAGWAASLCRIEDDPRRNFGAYLGTILAVLAQEGMDKITIISSPGLRRLADWLEQLIAESTGKRGLGILPVIETDAGLSGAYGPDRVFVSLELEGDDSVVHSARPLRVSGFPLITVGLKTTHELGSQFFLWEFAAAVAGFHLGINPFDQPDVEAAKKKTQEFLTIFKERGALPQEKPKLLEKGIGIFSDLTTLSLKDYLKAFLGLARPGDYFSILAFLDPTPETAASLDQIAGKLRARTRNTVTWGFGPRFLHSTGQLHKGDSGKGLYIQLTAGDAKDVPIPDSLGTNRSSLTFGVLKAAQARGDYEALKSLGRRILRLHLNTDALRGLAQVAAML